MNKPSKTFIENYNSGKPQLLWEFIVADLETPVSALIKLTKNKDYNFLLESVEAVKTEAGIQQLELHLILYGSVKMELLKQPSLKMETLFLKKIMKTLLNL